jgi:hypothetical protein
VVEQRSGCVHAQGHRELEQLSDSLSVSVVAFGSGGGEEGTTGAVNVSGVFIPNPRVNRILLPTNSSTVCSVYQGGNDGSCRQTVFPTQPLDAYVEFSSLPLDADVNVTIADDCGGTAGGVYLDGGGAYFNWTAPSTEAVCLLTATLTRDGLQDSMSIAIRAAGCADDSFEDSDTRNTAMRLGEGTYGGLQANDDDWYRILPYNSSLSIALATADVIEVEFYSGTTLLTSGTNGIPATSVTPRGDYHLRVRPGAAAETCGSQYELTISSN